MTIDKESWGYRRNAHAEDYYNMDELTEILAQTIRYAVYYRIQITTSSTFRGNFGRNLSKTGMMFIVVIIILQSFNKEPDSQFAKLIRGFP